MTPDDERYQQTIGLHYAEDHLERLSDRARRIADIYEAVARRLRSDPAAARSQISSHTILPSSFDGISAGEFSELINVHGLNSFADEFAEAKAKVEKLREQLGVG